jgi:NADH:ubiquinone oxidoreductase subunit 6 (subunit J)
MPVPRPEDALTAALVASTAGDVVVWVVWVVAALALLASGMAVILFSNPFYSALSLILNLGSLAVLYLLLSAEFVAAAQVLVYAGAVMVMFLFVIAYLGGRADTPFAGGRPVTRIAAIAAGAAIFLEIVVVISIEAGGSLSSAAEITDAFGSPREIGGLFLSDYLVAFEVTSIVLLVGAVGGVILGTVARRSDAEAEEDAPAAELRPPREAA